MIEVHTVQFEKAKLASLPEEERQFLLLSGHAMNEISLFNKWLWATVNTQETEPGTTLDYVNAGQSFITMRLLIGKLHEAYRLIDQRYKRQGALADRSIGTLSDRGVKAMEILDKEFGTNKLANIRNNLSFHYVDQEDRVEKAFQKTPDFEPWLIILSKMEGNCFYHFSEMSVQFAVLNEIAPKKPGENHKAWMDRSLRKLCSTLNRLVGATLQVLGDLFSSISTERFDLSSETEILPSTDLSDLRIPFFVNRTEAFDED